MKKSLLLFACAAMASVASAQGIAVMATTESLEAAGIQKDKTDIEGDVIFAENGEFGYIATAYKDSWGSTTTYKGYQNVQVGDVEVKLGSGAVGNANPTFVSYTQGVMSAGAVFKLHSVKTGYMTVFTKLNPNKQYLVFEGKAGQLGFTLGVAGSDYMIHYATPEYMDGDFIGFIDWDSPEVGKYFAGAQEQMVNENGEKLWYDKEGNVVAGDRPTWEGEDGKTVNGAAVMQDLPGQYKPQFPYLVAGLEKAPGESTGFLTFSVYEDTDYYFSALGSKAACGGFVFTEENPVVKFKEVLNEDGTVSLPERIFPAMGAGADPDAVEGLQAATDVEAPIYNAQGVRVNADAKGLLIQNGKKFIRK